MKNISLLCCYVALSCSLSFAAVRLPAVAGEFYPADKAELTKLLIDDLNNVPFGLPSEEIAAIIVPHAAYQFSGQVAAYAYRPLVGRTFKRVIILGSSHQAEFAGAVVPKSDAFETPLGQVPIDKEAVKGLVKSSPNISYDDAVHLKEHSIEVQLPFLQAVLGDDFRIVPILFGRPSLKSCQAVTKALDPLIDEETLVVVSTDWSHYYDYDTARKMDEQGLNAVVQNDLEGFVKALDSGTTAACAAPAVITLLMLAPALNTTRIDLLKTANSGDVTGDKKKVVGYAALAFRAIDTPLTQNDKKSLLKLARQTLEEELAGKPSDFKPNSEALAERRGVFVTLKKRRELRGCIGYIQPVKPLHEAVREMTIKAALHDNRFPPLTKAELNDVEVEISVLSKLKRVTDVSSIKVGRDGLFIIKGERSGILLPQVAEEFGWDRYEYLNQLCLKAGLPEGAWETKEARIYSFTAEIFDELAAKFFWKM